MPDFVASILCLAFLIYGGSLWKKAKIKSTVYRGAGVLRGESMREAFEQLIERQTCEQFEKWLENHETEQKAA